MIARIKYAPSRTPYALDLSSFAVDKRGWASVVAVWVTRKQGRTRVSSGQLRGFRDSTLTGFMVNFDGRYGGDCKARWDGESLWAPDLSPAEHAAEAARLDVILRGLPEVPDGYDGWYTINPKTTR
jgi:hypothetical protein